MNPSSKSIKDYENLYIIFPDGKVFSYLSNKFKKDWAQKDGYRIIGLIKNKKRTCFYIHRLVAETYLPKIEGKDFVNQSLNEYEQHYEMLNGQCRRYNDEGDYEVVAHHYCR